MQHILPKSYNCILKCYVFNTILLCMKIGDTCNMIVCLIY